MIDPGNPQEFWRLLQERAAHEPPIPMSQIAAELGYDVDELCAWIMAYRSPAKRSYWELPERERRLAIARHAAVGAAVARLQ